MNFKNETEAIEALANHGIEITQDCDIMYPRKREFIEEVHEAIEYLINDWDFGIKYI